MAARGSPGLSRNKMKHLSTLALLLLLFAGSARADRPIWTKDTTALERIETQDEKRIRRLHLVHFNLSADVPATDTVLRPAVTRWMDGLLGAQLGNGAGQTGADAAETARRYEKQFVDGARREVKELLKARGKDDPEARITYTYDLALRRVYETDRFVTFRAEAYTYTGGAHGMQYVAYGTFVKADGRLLTWDDIVSPKRKTRFRGLVADALMDFFGVQSFSAMKEKLLVDAKCTRSTFPLPEGTPGLLADGLHVQYADYEIAPHAAGMPGVTITYNQMKGLWTPYAIKIWR